MQYFKYAARKSKRSQLRRKIVVVSCQQRHKFFLNRIANTWNARTSDIIESGTVELLKNRFDKHQNQDRFDN